MQKTEICASCNKEKPVFAIVTKINGKPCHIPQCKECNQDISDLPKYLICNA